MAKSFKILRYLAAPLVFYSCSRPPAEISVSEKLSGFSIKRTKNGKPVWDISGETLVRNGKIYVSGARGRLYEKGSQKYFVKADRAVFTEKGEVLSLDGHVYVKNAADSSELYLDNLSWDEAKKIYFSDGKVRQVSKNSVVVGDGLTADKNLNRIEIKNPRVRALDGKK